MSADQRYLQRIDSNINAIKEHMVETRREDQLEGYGILTLFGIFVGYRIGCYLYERKYKND